MRTALAIGTIIAILPALALGQERYGPSAGDREFTLSGTGSSDKDFDNGTAGINATLGWYLTDPLMVGVRQSINYADIEGEDASNDLWNGSTSGFADYHFGRGALRPLVGASVGGIYGDGVNDTGFAGLGAGLKYYVLPSTFITGRADYQFFFEDGDEADDNFDDGAWAYSVGMGFNF